MSTRIRDRNNYSTDPGYIHYDTVQNMMDIERYQAYDGSTHFRVDMDQFSYSQVQLTRSEIGDNILQTIGHHWYVVGY